MILGKKGSLTIRMIILLTIGIIVAVGVISLGPKILDYFSDLSRFGFGGEDNSLDPDVRPPGSLDYVRFVFTEGINDWIYFYWNGDIQGMRVAIQINEGGLGDPGFKWYGDPNQDSDFKEGKKIPADLKVQVSKIMAAGSFDDAMKELVLLSGASEVETHFGRQFSSGDPNYVENLRASTELNEFSGWLKNDE